MLKLIGIESSKTKDYKTNHKHSSSVDLELDVIKLASQIKNTTSLFDNVGLPTDVSLLNLSKSSLASNTTSRFGVVTVFGDMEEELKPSHQQTLTPPESPYEKSTSFDITSLPSISSESHNTLDLSSPPPIKDLLISAEGLLSRLQNAYTQRTSALNDMIISRDNLAEELEEANTRTQSLRSQLEDLANTIKSKDQRIYELERELLNIKSQNSPSPTISHYYQSAFPISHEFKFFPTRSPLTFNEQKASDIDDEVIHDHSGIDLDISDDSDYECGTNDSIFSRPRSPALTTASSILSRSPRLRPISISPPTSFRLSSENDPVITSKKPTVQTPKNFFGFLSSRVGNKQVPTSDPNICTNCSGQDSRAAWDTVSLLRIENQTLKDRIVDLEDAVDEALDAVKVYF